MRICVVPNDMSRSLDGTGNIGTLPDVPSYEKECGAGIVARKNIEQAKRIWVVRTIIVSQCCLSGIAAVR